MPQKPLSHDEIEHAKRMHDAGETWTEVGRELAHLRGRRSPYQPESIRTAIKRCEREIANLGVVE